VHIELRTPKRGRGEKDEAGKYIPQEWTVPDGSNDGEKVKDIIENYLGSDLAKLLELLIPAINGRAPSEDAGIFAPLRAFFGTDEDGETKFQAAKQACKKMATALGGEAEDYVAQIVEKLEKSK